jgi:hypothetical protein
MSRRGEFLLMLVILVAAAWLRFRGLAWGLPYPYHPDEGSILFHALGFGTGDLNPHWFRWPSLLMYVMFGVYGAFYVVGRIAGAFGAPADLVRSYVTDPTPFWMMGRVVSAAAGTATVWVTYRIGRRAFGTFAGLAGALFLAVVYLHVRDSHYATPDVAATFLAALALLFAVRARDRSRASDLVLSGLFAGLAASAKYPAALAGAATVAALAALVSRREISGWILPGIAGVALAGFVAGTPYSVLAAGEFLHDVARQFTMVSTAGVAQEPTTFAEGLREVFGRTVAHGVTWPLAAAAVAGIVVTAGRGWARWITGVYTLAFVVAGALLTVKRSTYLTPALPGIAALAAAGVGAAADRLLRRSPGAARGAGVAASLAIAAFAVVPSLRFDSALLTPDTRTLAREWVEANVQPGAAIAVEGYGPVLNPTTDELRAIASEATTRVETWEGPKRGLARIREEVGSRRGPQYVVYGIGQGEPPYALPAPGEDAAALVRALERGGIRYVVLSSKAAPWRAMAGAEPPGNPVRTGLEDWLAARGELLARFAPERPEPPIDRGAGRSFHNPVIEIYAVRPAAGASEDGRGLHARGEDGR